MIFYEDDGFKDDENSLPAALIEVPFHCIAVFIWPNNTQEGNQKEEEAHFWKKVLDSTYGFQLCLMLFQKYYFLISYEYKTTHQKNARIIGLATRTPVATMSPP